jgi:MerR family transcriptional regulator, light-induced transcriptional regulator
MSQVRTSADRPLIRIGELATRAGVPSATLRAWERRYDVIRPVRGESGYRLYSPEDERRLHSMVALVEVGVAPAEAAEWVRGDAAAEAPRDGSGTPQPLAAMRKDLIEALLDFNGTRAERVLDRAIGILSVEAFVGELVFPVLRVIGERWAEGEASIGQEHFASNMLRGRLMGMARGWGGGEGPSALLACPPGEHHDLGLIGFGLALRELGWRITFLGSDTPIASIVSCAEEMEPDVVVAVARSRGLLEAVEAELRALSSGLRLMLAGTEADEGFATRVGAERLTGEPVEAARSLMA